MVRFYVGSRSAAGVPEEKMSLEYIRRVYKVPAKRGLTVLALGRKGIITGARGSYLLIRLEGERKINSYHPTWEMEYLTRSKEEENEKRRGDT